MAVKKRKNYFAVISVFSILFILFIGLGIIVRKQSAFVCCGKPLLADNFDFASKEAIFEGKKMEVPFWVFEDNIKEAAKYVLGSTAEEKWIDIDLSDQKLKAWEGNTLFLESLVSTGLPWFPTPQGEFRIWAKTRATKMEGGEGKYYYYLPNVPFVMFFENKKVPGFRGYGFHGTYWHNDFGRVHSHGCVNLPTPVAEKLYYWTTPLIPQGKFFTLASEENFGTKIIIHE